MPTFGQQLILGFHGCHPEDAEPRLIQDYLRHKKIGGVILFGHNIQDRHQLRNLIQSFYDASPDNIPFVAIDQEGGRVQRLSAANGFQNFFSAWDVAQNYTPEQAIDIYCDMASMLKEVGFNLNFGPVVDLTYPQDSNKVCPVIGAHGRSYGVTPAQVEDFSRAFVEGHRKAGVVSCLKHYPGHGLSLKDSHEGLVDITNTYQFYEEDPFKNLSHSGHADMIMVGHLMHRTWDPAYPTSLSLKTMERLRAFYQGVVITDDLLMGAIVHHYPLKTVIQQTLKAGVDLLIFSSNKMTTGTPKYFQLVTSKIDRLHQMVDDLRAQDDIYQQSLSNSHQRLLSLKKSYGLLK
ncbi:MAG: glycoside hydrolase family 3 N-terminal domain-containing protein [Janthinobacterium lividum]